jgi:hypothetical protein
MTDSHNNTFISNFLSYITLMVVLIYYENMLDRQRWGSFNSVAEIITHFGQE